MNRKYAPLPRNDGINKPLICFLITCCCCIIPLGMVYIAWYYHTTEMDERHEIDISNTSVSEPYLDKITDIHANCTQVKPCKYTCEYVKEHFRQNHDDCEYKDWHHIIRIIFELWFVLAAISITASACGCSNKKSSSNGGA